MTQEERQRALSELFETEGWRIFLADIEAQATALNVLTAAKDQNDFFRRQGMVYSLANVLGYENTQAEVEYD